MTVPWPDAADPTPVSGRRLTMAKATPPTSAADTEAASGRCGKVVRLVRGVMEAVVLLLVCLAPWAFGAADPVWELALYAGVGLLTLLWGAAILLEGQLSWRKCPVVLCLAALFLLGFWQITPLSRQVLGTVSPGAARMYDQVLPGRPEVLPGGEARAVPPFPAGSTMSLYPGATQRELVRILAVILVFAAVRKNIASAAAFRRLAVAATINGALLSLFALIQFFSSPRDVIYWTDHTEGEVFGPFICRNHFSFYVNICAGLAVGLLLSFGAVRGGRSQAGDWERGGYGGRDGRRGGEWLRPYLTALHDPKALWVGIALVLMLAAVAVSLSRGGFMALIGAAFFCLALKLWRSPRFASLGAVVLLAGAALALVTWFGADRVKARLATVWDGQAAREDRIPMWSRLLPVATNYPLLGSGYGTFDYLEPLTRTTGEDSGYRFEHAHNDYLESLLEGGLVRLGLGLLAVGLVYRLGCRAFLRDADGPGGALALGGLFGVTALVIHSFVDFGLHIPAIALFATVLCAHLCAAGDRAGGPVKAGVPAAADRYTFRLLGVAPAAGAVVLVSMGVMLMAEGWRAERVQEFRETAARLRKTPDPARHELAVNYLEAAAAIAPEYGVLHAQLAEVRWDVMHEKADALSRGGRAADAAQALLAFAPPTCPAGAASPAAGGPLSWLTASYLREDWLAARNKALLAQYQRPALRDLLHARDACPLLAAANLQLALHAGELDQADGRGDYLRRAKLLDPDDPDTWYLCGVQEVFDDQREEAWKSWRRSLELSNRRLPEIVASLSQRADAADVLDRVLPDRPVLWLAAADQLYPEPEAGAKRRPFLEKALLLLERQPSSLSGDELHQQAAIFVALGRGPEALATYQKALDQQPNQAGWRYEFARLLRDQGRLQESRRELSGILAERPGDAQARELLDGVAHDIAAGK